MAGFVDYYGMEGLKKYVAGRKWRMTPPGGLFLSLPSRREHGPWPVFLDGWLPV